MIFRIDVKQQAEKYINELFKEKLEAKRFLLEPELFSRFVDILHVRVNELETIVLKDRKDVQWSAFATIIKNAVLVYANGQARHLLKG